MLLYFRGAYGFTARIRPPHLPRTGPAIAQQILQAPGQGATCAMTSPRDPRQRDLGDGIVHDHLATGGKLRMLTIVDIFSHFSPALESRLTFRGTDVVEVLERVSNEVGFPATIRVDQGSEFVSRYVDLWVYQRGACWTSHSPASRPTTPSSGNSGLNASTSIGSCPLRTPRERWRFSVDTITRNGPTGRSAIDHRFCCRITPAQPARQRDQRRKNSSSG